MMLVCEGVVIVEMTIPTDGLAIFGIRHGHVTRHDFIVLLSNTYNRILGVIVTPSRDEHSILVVIRQTVVSSIVDREQCLERQALQETVHIIDNTCIKLELTTHVCGLTTEIAICNSIGLSGFRTTGEIFSVQQVERLAKDGQRLRGIGVNHVNRNQRGCILREIRTTIFASIAPVAIRQLFTCGFMPEFTLVLVCIVECRTGVGETLDEFVDHQVYITTYAETVCVVILGLTEVQQILYAIIINVRVEVSTLTTTLNLQCSF